MNTDTIIFIIILVTIAAVIGLIIWRRRQIMIAATIMIYGLRRIISPRWNNRIFLALCAVSFILFCNAVYHGGGEPLGTRALRNTFAPAPSSGIMLQYHEASKYLVGDNGQKKENPTWFWWKAWFVSLLTTLVFIPFAFWDETRDAWRNAMDRLEQRRAVINLRPEPISESQQTTGHGRSNTPSESANWWQRFRERVLAGASANALYEFAEGLARRILTERIMRGVKR